MTIAQARSYVLARLGISSGESATVDALIDLQLDQEYQRIVLEQALEVDVAQLVTTADDPLVDLPDDLNEILKINLGTVTLEPIDPDSYAKLSAYEDQTLDGPVAYMRSGSRRIRLFPSAVADGTDLRCWYTSAAETWNDANPVPLALPAPFHDLPCERVVAFLALLDEATDLAAIANARADDLEARLIRHMGRRGGMATATIPVRGLS